MDVTGTTPKNNNTIRVWVFTLLGLLLGFLGLYMLAIQFRYVATPGSDFKLYYDASRNLIQGRSIYTDPYFQSPFLAIAIVPFALFPFHISAVVWSIGIIACYITMCWLIYQELKFRLSIEARVLLAGAAIAWFPFLENVSQGQISIPLSLIIVSAWIFIRREKYNLSAIILGMACLIKLFPGLFLFFLLFRKKWKAVSVMAGTVLLGFLFTALIVGFKDFFGFFLRVIPEGSIQFYPIPMNFSIRGAVYRLYADNPWVYPFINSPTLADIVTLLLDIIILIVFIKQITRLPRSIDGDDRSFSITTFAMLLLSPISWPHIFPILLLPLGLLLKQFLDTRNIWLFRLGIIVLILVSLPYLKISIALMQFYDPLPIPSVIGLVFLLPSITVLLIWIILTGRLPYTPLKNGDQS